MSPQQFYKKINELTGIPVYDVMLVFRAFSTVIIEQGKKKDDINLKDTIGRIKYIRRAGRTNYLRNKHNGRLMTIIHPAIITPNIDFSEKVTVPIKEATREGNVETFYTDEAQSGSETQGTSKEKK